MKHSRLRRRPVPPEFASAVLEPGQLCLLPVTPGEPLDLGRCFRSGQIFRWRQVGDTWYGPFGDAALALTPGPGGIRVEGAGEPVALSEIYRFLALDAPMTAIQQAVTTDRSMAGAVAAFGGLRILRQQPWECLAGYLCSQWNNIPKIEGSTERIARIWGVTRTFRRAGRSIEVACFPSPATLASRGEHELRQCALGYRCAYLVGTARLVADGAVRLDVLRGASYAEALTALLRLPGVGRKVADCILLFSLDRWEAFPVDVWVRRAMRDLYGKAFPGGLPGANARAVKTLSSGEYRALVEFAWRRWGAVAGWAQQYLFCARRLGVIQPG
jgi:N-glycosylase/DNA lyase